MPTKAPYSHQNSPIGKSVGMPVTVIARTGTPVSGLFVPRAAVVQAPNGQIVVFEHREPEVFMPRPVRTEPFDNEIVLANVDTGVVSLFYLSLDQGIVMAALGNALADDVLRKAFATPDVRQVLDPLRRLRFDPSRGRHVT